MTVIEYGPVARLAEMVTRMLVSLHETMVPDTATPFWVNCTRLLPWVAPKPVPITRIVPPGAALGGATELMIGLLIWNAVLEGAEMPFTTTVIGPDVAPLGTRATIWLSHQTIFYTNPAADRKQEL